jgi:hypothetical protein
MMFGKINKQIGASLTGKIFFGKIFGWPAWA